MGAPLTYEEYLLEESKKYAAANYSTGTDPAAQEAWSPPPAQEVAPQYQAQPQYSEPAPEPAPQTIYEEPTYDPGYTLDQQPAPSQPGPQSNQASQEPPADYVTMPGETNAFNPSTGEEWSPEPAMSNPANAWLGPRTNPSRDPVMPESQAPPPTNPYDTTPSTYGQGMAGPEAVNSIYAQEANRLRTTPEGSMRLADIQRQGDTYVRELAERDQAERERQAAATYVPPRSLTEPGPTVARGPSNTQAFDRAAFNDDTALLQNRRDQFREQNPGSTAVNQDPLTLGYAESAADNRLAPDDGGEGLLGSLTAPIREQLLPWAGEQAGNALSAIQAERAREVEEGRRRPGEDGRLTADLVEGAQNTLTGIRGLAQGADQGLQRSALGQSGVYEAGMLPGALEGAIGQIPNVVNALWNDDQSVMERTAQQAYDLATQGDPHATTGAGPFGIGRLSQDIQRGALEATGVDFRDPYTRWLSEHPDDVRRLMEEGFTPVDAQGKPGQTVPPGPAAVVAAYHHQASLPESLLSSTLNDRTTMLPVGGGVMRGVAGTGRIIQTAPGAGPVRQGVGRFVETTGRVGEQVVTGADSAASFGLDRLGNWRRGPLDYSPGTKQVMAADETEEATRNVLAAQRVNAQFNGAAGGGQGGQTVSPNVPQAPAPAPAPQQPVSPNGAGRVAGAGPASGLPPRPAPVSQQPVSPNGAGRTAGPGPAAAIADQPGAGRMDEPVEGFSAVNLTSDQTGRYWITDNQTGGVIYGPMTADQARQQIRHAENAVTQARLTGQTTQPNVTGRTTPPPDPATQPRTIVRDPATGMPRLAQQPTTPTAAGRQAPQPAADPNLIQRTVQAPQPQVRQAPEGGYSVFDARTGERLDPGTYTNGFEADQARRRLLDGETPPGVGRTQPAGTPAVPEQIQRNVQQRPRTHEQMVRERMHQTWRETSPASAQRQQPQQPVAHGQAGRQAPVETFYEPSRAATDPAPQRRGVGQPFTVPDGAGGRRPPSVAELQQNWERQLGIDARTYDSANERAWRGAMFDQNVLDPNPSGGRAFENYLRIEAEQYKRDPAYTQARWDRETRTAAGIFPARQNWIRRVANGEDPAAVRRSIPQSEMNALNQQRMSEAREASQRTGRSQRVLRITAPSPGQVIQEGLERGQDLRRRAEAPGPIRKTAEQADDAGEEITRNKYSQRLGATIADDDNAVLEQTLKTGVNRGREKGEVLEELANEVDELRTLVQRQTQSLQPGATRLSQADEDRIRELERKLNLTDVDTPAWGTMDDATADNLIARLMRREEEISSGFRNAAGAQVDTYKGVLGGALKVYDNYLGIRRALQLYNPARGPAYVLMNAIGNAISLGIARPGALGDYLKPVEWKRIKQRQANPQVQSRVDDTRQRVGLSPSPTIRDVNKDELGRDAITRSKNVFGDSGFAKVMAPLSKLGFEQARNFANVFDTSIREALWRNVFEGAIPQARRELQRHAQETLARSQAAGKAVPVSTDRLNAAFETLAKDGRFSQADVRRAILDAADDPNSQAAKNFAERMGRDWLNGVRSIDKAAKKEVDRVAFSFRATNADEAIKRFFMFHYWTSRASKLYLTESIKKPYLAAAYFNLMEGLERDAEKNNYPDWLKGTIQVFKSPAGVGLFMDPSALIGTLVSGRDSFYQEERKNKDLTAVGEYMQYGMDTGFEPANLLLDIPRNAMMVPIIEGALAALGTFGPDTNANPDLLGERWATQLYVDAANLFAQHGIDFPGVTRTEAGNPERLPANDLSTHLNNALKQALGGKVPGLDPALPRNPDRGALRFNGLLLTATEQLNPGMSEQQVADRATEALADPDSEEYKLALDMFSRGPGIQVLEGHSLPDWLQWGVDHVAEPVINAAVGSRANPFNPQISTDKDIQLQDPQTEGQAAQKNVLFGTPESLAFDKLVEGHKNAGTVQGNLAQDGWSAIRYASQDVQPFRVGDRVYTRDDLLAMSDEERKELADEWVSWMGFDESRRTAYDAQNAYVEEHPEIKPVLEFRQQAKDYPGGPRSFMDNLAQHNAPYRQFLLDLSGNVDPASDEYVGIATSASGYEAAMGRTSGSFGIYPDRTGAEEIPTADGTIITDLGAAYDQRQAAREAEFGGSDEFVESVTKDLAEVAQIRNRINAYDPSGATWAAYQARIATGDESIKLPYDLYQALNAEFGHAFPSGGAAEYVGWAYNRQQQGLSTDFETWREEDLKEYRAEQEAKEAEIGSDFAPDDLFNPQPASDTARPASGRVTPNSGRVNARLEPGIGSDVAAIIPAGMPLNVLGEDTLNGETWVQVQLPGGRTGWILASLLNKAP